MKSPVLTTVVRSVLIIKEHLSETLVLQGVVRVAVDGATYAKTRRHRRLACRVQNRPQPRERVLQAPGLRLLELVESALASLSAKAVKTRLHRCVLITAISIMIMELE